MTDSISNAKDFLQSISSPQSRYFQTLDTTPGKCHEILREVVHYPTQSHGRGFGTSDKSTAGDGEQLKRFVIFDSAKIATALIINCTESSAYFHG